MSAAGTADLAEIATAAFPEIAGQQVARFDSGFDSVVLAIGPLTFKFPRDADAEARLRHEAAVLSAIGPHLTMNVPHLTVHEGERVFSSHVTLAGRAFLRADYIRLDDAARGRIGADLGRFFAEMHALPRALIPKPRRIERWQPAQLTEAILLPATIPPALRLAAAAQIVRFEALGPDPLGEAFSHFDAHGWNMAFDPDRGRLNGIFDFGDSGVADVHEEWLCPSMVHPGLSERSMLEYEALTGCHIDRARVTALTTVQRLDELAGAANYPDHAMLTRAVAMDWLEHLADRQ